MIMLGLITIRRVRALGCRPLLFSGFFASLFASLLFTGWSMAQTASSATALPSETPAKVEPVSDSFDYVKREVML